jgi:hypothetical protein
MASMLPRRSHVRSHAAGHLTRKRGVYYFRRRVPKAWHLEITICLRTRDFRRAEHLAERIDSAFIIAMEKALHLSEASVAALRKHLRDLIEGDDELRRNAQPYQPVYTRIDPEDESDVIDADLEIVDHLLGEARERLANRDAAARMVEANALIAEHGLPDDQRHALAMGVLHTEIRLLEIIRRRVLDWDEAPWLIDGPIAVEFAL